MQLSDALQHILYTATCIVYWSDEKELERTCENETNRRVVPANAAFFVVYYRISVMDYIIILYSIQYTDTMQLLDVMHTASANRELLPMYENDLLAIIRCLKLMSGNTEVVVGSFLMLRRILILVPYDNTGVYKECVMIRGRDLP